MANTQTHIEVIYPIDRDGHYQRALTRHLGGMGVDDPKAVTWHSFESDRQRFEAWLVESLLSGIREFNIGRTRVALRCLLQAADYCGRIGGFWPGPVASDAYIVLKNALEDLLS